MDIPNQRTKDPGTENQNQLELFQDRSLMEPNRTSSHGQRFLLSLVDRVLANQQLSDASQVIITLTPVVDGTQSPPEQRPSA